MNRIRHITTQTTIEVAFKDLMDVLRDKKVIPSNTRLTVRIQDVIGHIDEDAEGIRLLISWEETSETPPEAIPAPISDTDSSRSPVSTPAADALRSPRSARTRAKAVRVTYRCPRCGQVKREERGKVVYCFYTPSCHGVAMESA